MAPGILLFLRSGDGGLGMATGTPSAGTGEDPGPVPPGPPPALPDGRTSRFGSALRWQAVIAAVIAAVATVVAAVVATSGSGGEETTPSAAGASSGKRPSVSVISWRETPSEPPSKSYEFLGSVSDLPEGSSVRVIVEVPARTPTVPGGKAPEGTEWLVSPAADLLQNGGWKVAWKVARPPAEAQWVAVVVANNCPMVNGQARCPAGHDPVTDNLTRVGPGSSYVSASSTASPATRSSNR